MEKKLYITPLFEVTACENACGIMKTSVGMEGSNMPGEPGEESSGLGGAPKRRTPVF